MRSAKFRAATPVNRLPRMDSTENFRQGAETFGRIRGMISILKKHSLSVIEGIRAAFEGKSILHQSCS